MNTLSRLQSGMEKILPFLLTATMFVIPISSSLRSIFFPLAALSILLVPTLRKQIIAALKHPVVIAMLVFYAWVLIACIWSPATLKQQSLILRKYDKLLFLPFFAVGFQDARARIWGLYAFLVVMLITAIMSIAQKYGLSNPKGYTDVGAVFYNHIITGAMIAFAAWLSFFLAGRQKGMIRGVLVVAGLLLSYQTLFVNTGRTGYVMYFVLMIILFFQLTSIKRAFILAVVFSVFMVGIYAQSSIMQQGLGYVVSDVKEYKKEENKDTSIGYRIQFHLYAKSLFLKHPVIGNGTGSFGWNFNKDRPIPSWDPNYFEPHSQYWLIGSEQGIVGLIFLAAFLVCLVRLALKTPEYGPVLFSFVFIFCMGSLTDSLLLLSPVGFLLILFAGMCIGKTHWTIKKS